jgi:ABC-type branched-subunit amino acid transport system ATPase component/ABC-type branched-subunit amino acid transport system permease subunit
MVIRGHGLPLRGELTDRLPRLGTGVPRRGPLLIVLGAVIVSIFAFDTSWVASVSISATVALIGLSVVVVTGYAGQLSLAQFALAGVAALISSRLADAAGAPFLLAALVGVAATALIGVLIALPAVRVRGVNLAVVTMALAVVISSAVLSNTDLNGGAIRGTRVPDPTIFGLNVQATAHPERWAGVCLVALVLGGSVVSNLRRGRSGRRLIAVRNNERAAASLGVNVFVSKLYAFGVGAGLAGVGGVLLAFRNPSVDFGQFSPFQSILILLLTVIGGIGFIGGGVVAGAGIVGGAFEHALGSVMDINDLYRFVLALLFLVAIVIHPHGITEFASHHLNSFSQRLRRQRQGAEDEPAAPTRITPVEPKTLVAEGLTVRFGGVTALSSVSFEVRPGEVLGLIGPNGAGKTTIVDAITGFVAPSGGTVSLDGVTLNKLRPDQRASLGLTRSFQSLELFEDLSVGDNLRVAADDGGLLHLLKDLLRVRRHHLSPAALAVIEEFGLSDVLDRSSDDLSYAERRSVAIARAVASNPSVLLLDEPAAGLDAAARADLEHLIRRLAREWKMAILLIEHDVALVMRTCDRVMALNFGVTLTTGTPDEVRRNESVIGSYLGEDDPSAVGGVSS